MNTVGSSALSLLQSLNGASQNLYGALSGSSNGASGGADPVASLILAEKTQTTAVAKQAKEPQTKRDIDRFTAVLAKAKDVKSLLADPIARKVLLTANGLGDQTDFAALASKALLSDTTKPGSLASKLGDARWLTLAKTYDFANKGLSVLKQPNVLKAVTNGYAEVQWRQSLDETTPGLSAALDFRSRAASVKNVDEILGDANLRKVVTTALGIPQQIAFQPLMTQEKAISSKLDLAKLKDPKFVEQFARRFLVANAASATSSVYA